MSIAATSQRTAVDVVLTGRHYEIASLGDELESLDSGVTVLARVRDVQDPSARIGVMKPHVVLHRASWDGYGTEAEAGLRADVAAIRRQTGVPIILLVPGDQPDVVEAALAAGVDDVVLLPQPKEMIAFAARKACLGVREIDGRATGNVITVFSPKGGTGKTVLASNLACYLASKSRKRVLLIDLDLQFGDAAIMLGLDPERTMFDLVQSGGELDPGKLQAYTTRHKSGLDVLVAPMLPEQAELVTEERVVQLVQVAREAYDIVVIDTSPFFYGPMLALLGPTDQLLLLCGLDVPTLKNVRLSLRTLSLLGFPLSRTSLVMNRVSPDVGLTCKDVETALGIPVAFEVPNDLVVTPAVNRGAMPALKEPDSEFTQSVARIAAAFEPTLVAPHAAAEEQFAGTARLRRLVTRHMVEGRA